MSRASIVQAQIKDFIKGHKLFTLAVILILLMAIVSICIKMKPKSVIGNYPTVHYEDRYFDLSLDKSYFSIAGVDEKTKKSEMYLRLDDNLTGRLEGYVYLVAEYKDYQKYRFNITKQTGTLFGKMNFIYFEYYPGRGDNGLIEVTGDGVVIDFSR